MLRFARHVLCVAGLCMALCLPSGCADGLYRGYEQMELQGRIDTARAMLEAEKAWIAQNQDKNGAIYLNGSLGARDVNPYFACQAAMGLLAGQPSQADFDRVAAYLRWHSAHLVAYGGRIPHFQCIEGEWMRSGDYDSIDSYVAAYLTLLAEYEQKGGDLESVKGWRNAVRLCAAQLELLFDKGLTHVSDVVLVSYLMDNAEVWEACDRMWALLKAHPDAYPDAYEQRALSDLFMRMEREIRYALETTLWNELETRFEIGINGDGSVLNNRGWERFYPDAIAQVYPKACGMRFSPHIERGLYEQLCSRFSWEEMLLDEDFDWAVMAYIAVQMGDVDRAETFLAAYRTAYETERIYPFHTAEAGWAARACSALIALYEQRMTSNMMTD